MRKFEWNALRLHDKVLVHDAVGTDHPLIPGVVAAVESRKRSIALGIRVAGPDGEKRILWPSSLTVHHDPRNVAEPCWRCQANADADARSGASDRQAVDRG